MAVVPVKTKLRPCANLECDEKLELDQDFCKWCGKTQPVYVPPSDGEEESSEEESEEEEEEEEVQRPIPKPRNKEALERLMRTVRALAPPAPYSAPPHHRSSCISASCTGCAVAPGSLLMEASAAEGTSCLNSTVGRFFIFFLTLVTFIGAIYGIMGFQARELQMVDGHRPMMMSTFCSIAFLFACLPKISEKAGMHASNTGWKPYLVMYRCSFFLAVPAITCIGLGFGSLSWFGAGDGVAGEILVNDLERASGKYFEAADGYVALNLTKGITETIQRTTHGDFGYNRISKYKDAALRINREPFTGLVDPTIPPGAQQMYVVAPIFSEWAPCVSKYKISSKCLRANAAVGWAMIKAESLCKDMRMLACRPVTPQLNPVYKCSSATESVRGRDTAMETQGLCGRVVVPPPLETVDELKALLMAEGWPDSSLPNSTLVWVDVSPDDCISNPTACTGNWNAIGIVGVLFAVLTGGCIIIPAVFDWMVDRRIREARKDWEERIARRAAAGLA